MIIKSDVKVYCAYLFKIQLYCKEGHFHQRAGIGFHSIYFLGMKVNGYRQLFGCPYSSTYLILGVQQYTIKSYINASFVHSFILCSAEETNSYRFGINALSEKKYKSCYWGGTKYTTHAHTHTHTYNNINNINI